MSVVVTVWVSVGMFVVYRPLLQIVFFSLGALKYVACFCKECDGCCVFCLYCEGGTVCLCLVCILWQFCMTYSVLMRVKDAKGDHMEEAYSRTGVMTALSVAKSVCSCLAHPVAVNDLFIYRGSCACTEML